MNPNEITHLSQLNTMFHGYEESLFNADGNLIAAVNLYPMSPNEIDNQEYRRMCLDDQLAESDFERHDILAERFYDERFDNDNEDALREQDEYDREHETGRYDYRNDY